MLSKNELRALSDISNGTVNIHTLSKTLGLSPSQIYKTVRSLVEKDFVILERGRLSLEKKTHIAILSVILRDSKDSYIVLSDSGLEIIRTLIEPHTVSEIHSMTGLHQTTITRKIDLMRRMGMVKKEGSTYSINEELFPNIIDLAHSYNEYVKLTDPRVPFGSEIYHLSKDVAVFSSNKTLNDTRTAFSKYGDHGMTIYPGENFYCSSDHELDIKDVFLHSLYVVEKDRNWRSKMLALIFFVKHKHELNDVSHPVVDDMRTVLNGGKVDGWVPLKEMQERATMYGVDLYDN